MTWQNLVDKEWISAWIQEDDGSFGGWTNVIQILNQWGALESERNTVLWTNIAGLLTSGRHYRLAVSTLGDKSSQGVNFFNCQLMLASEGSRDQYVPYSFLPYQQYLDDVTPYAGQSITGDGGTLRHIEWVLKRQGTPTGNLKCYLYAHTGTYGTSSLPTGAALATATERPASDVVDGSYTRYRFDFPTPYTLVNGTKYVIALEYDDGDSSNYIACGVLPAGYHDGNSIYWYDGGWVTDPDYEVIFYLYTSVAYLNKLEVQKLLLNRAVNSGTGLQNGDSLHDPVELDGYDEVAYHEATVEDAGSNYDGDAKLQEDVDDTPSDITGSTITDCIQRERSSAVTLPSSADDIDVNITSFGTASYFTASRLISLLTRTAAAAAGWSGKIWGVTAIGKIMGVSVSDIDKVKGVE
jgi:hypothetical protein